MSLRNVINLLNRLVIVFKYDNHIKVFDFTINSFETYKLNFVQIDYDKRLLYNRD